MSKEPTKEQVKEFWEWCRFKWGKIDYVSNLCSELNSTYEAWMSPLAACSDKSQPLCSEEVMDELPPIDLNNLFKYAPDIIVGIYFRFYPGSCECELTYITEAGFDAMKSWVKNETGDENESKKLSALALFWALYKTMELDK